MIDVPSTSQNLAEFEQLLDIYKELKPKKILEIGTHEGGTLYYWIKYAAPNSIIGSIDIQRLGPDRYMTWREDESVSIIHLTQPSQLIESALWAKDNLAPIDWLFIDGGHSYEEVLLDFGMYGTLVKEGGIIALHDILFQPNAEVDRVWKRLKKQYATTEIIESHEKWQRGPGIGIIWK